MHNAIEKMLNQYRCQSQQDYLNALKEIIQEIALLGLWRAKFYEKAAFYGGSALRILYGLDRFSEDLDFTLLKQENEFQLTPYNQAVEKELNSFGFEVSVSTKLKNIQSNIESAFIKANSTVQLLMIEAPRHIMDKIHAMHAIKIKMEVDTTPPGLFSTEVKTLLQPIPFSINTLTLPDLFAGKIHALLCRPWIKRVKGRDWYDFIWYISNSIPVNLVHLRERLIQSAAYNERDNLSRNGLIELLQQKINTIDFISAKTDISPFIKDQQALDLWSTSFFTTLLGKLKVVS